MTSGCLVASVDAVEALVAVGPQVLGLVTEILLKELPGVYFVSICALLRQRTHILRLVVNN